MGDIFLAEGIKFCVNILYHSGVKVCLLIGLGISPP